MHELQHQLETAKEQIQEKESELERARSKHVETEIHELQHQLETAKEQIQEKESELERARSNHERELSQCRATFQRKLKEKERELERAKEQNAKVIEHNVRASCMPSTMQDHKNVIMASYSNF